MKTHLRSGALLCALLFAQTIPVFAQGSLTPPAAPTPTMKSLDQIASTGIALNDVNTPGDTNYHFIINAAGNYYLTANLLVTKTNGIHVIAAGATIELNGFQITRGSGSGGNAITIDGLGHRCTVKNGSIRGFNYGINCVLSPGLARSGSFRQLALYNCASAGVVAGNGWQIDGCTAHENGTGFFCGDGDTLTNCTALNNSSSGYSGAEGSSLINCTAQSNSIGFGYFSDSAFTNCSATENSSYGFYLGPGCALAGCIAGFNNNSGITLNGGSGSVTSCTARNNGSGTGFTWPGIDARSSSTVKDCTVINNYGDGILADTGSVILNNTCEGNGSGVDSGIHVTGQKNRIEGNSAIDNQIGFKANSSGNLIIKNSNRGGGGAFSLAAGNSVGEMINVFNGGAGANITSTNPWANFLY